MSYEENFLNVYPAVGSRYTFTTTVRHKGTVIAFAMNDQRRLYYAVLALDNQDPNRAPQDMKYWPKAPAPLMFPNEMTQVGFGDIAQTQMPLVDQAGREAAPGTLRPQEADVFRSSTACLTAPAPFQVLSDGSNSRSPVKPSAHEAFPLVLS